MYFLDFGDFEIAGAFARSPLVKGEPGRIAFETRPPDPPATYPRWAPTRKGGPARGGGVCLQDPKGARRARDGSLTLGRQRPRPRLGEYGSVHGPDEC